MSDTQEQAQLREHLREMRRAVGGLGHDFRIEFEDLDGKITRLGALTAREARDAVLDIHDDFANLGRRIDTEIERLPGQVSAGFQRAGSAIESGAVRVGSVTRDALTTAGSKAKEGTKNALAAAAGVRRTPMKEWHSPGSAAAARPDDE